MNKKNYVSIVLGCLLITVTSGVSWWLGKTGSTGESTTEFILTSDVGVGQPVEGKYEQVEVPARFSVSKGNLVNNTKELQDAVASHNLYKNQPLTKDSVRVEDKNLARNLKVSVPITVTGAVGGDLKAGDIVAVRVKYKDEIPDDTVVSSIVVNDIRTSNGGPIVDANTLPGLLNFYCTEEEASDMNSGSRLGSLYVAKYDNLAQPRLEKTFSTEKAAALDPNAQQKAQQNAQQNGQQGNQTATTPAKK